MYMYNMLLRFEKKIFCHIRTQCVYRKYIFLYENKSCSLLGLNCIKVINFSSLYQIFSVGTKQGNDSNVNLYYTIRFPYFISLTSFLFSFCNYTPAPLRGRGVYCFTSVRPRYFSSHFSQ